MGHHNHHFGGDQHSLRGAWSPPNSRANFCEEDYTMSFYLAEFINSVSNLAYVYFALKAIYQRREADFMSLSLLALGVGSFLFHATLRHTMEFCDELSMLLLTWSMLHAVLTVRQTKHRSRIISFALAVVFLSFSAFYVWSATIIYQVIAFSCALGMVTARGQYLLNWMPDSERWFGTERSNEWNARTRQAIGVCIFGYVLWHIDLEFCMELRALRGMMGLPWAWGLELHGWWHVLTAIGAAKFMDVAREIREEEKEERAKAGKKRE
ncbi:ceramidase [Cladorrhinum sp. PSN259]|nr:ceramidase [Cladorrhinum sp. PSN259]